MVETRLPLSLSPEGGSGRATRVRVFVGEGMGLLEG